MTENKGGKVNKKKMIYGNSEGGNKAGQKRSAIKVRKLIKDNIW